MQKKSYTEYNKQKHAEKHILERIFSMQITCIITKLYITLQQ